MDWQKTKNIVGLEGGSYRSVLGYAGESLVVGRALLCGFNVFFKAWRDSKYDAVIECEGVLHRVEIKQTSDGKNLSLTSGARSGKQIDRDVASRSEPVSKKDSEFLIGVHSGSGRCWILPSELIEILDRDNFTTSALPHFEEKWGIFVSNPKLPVGLEEIQDGFSSLDEIRLDELLASLGVTDLPMSPAEFTTHWQGNRGMRPVELEPRKWKIVTLWLEIFKRLDGGE